MSDTKEETRGERRAETARENDDSDIIDAATDSDLPPPTQEGSKGGDLQRDIATQAERERATDPDRHESVKKHDHIAHGQGETTPRTATSEAPDSGH